MQEAKKEVRKVRKIKIKLETDNNKNTAQQCSYWFKVKVA